MISNAVLHTCGRFSTLASDCLGAFSVVTSYPLHRGKINQCKMLTGSSPAMATPSRPFVLVIFFFFFSFILPRAGTLQCYFLVVPKVLSSSQVQLHSCARSWKVGHYLSKGIVNNNRVCSSDEVSGASTLHFCRKISLAEKKLSTPQLLHAP